MHQHSPGWTASAAKSRKVRALSSRVVYAIAARLLACRTAEENRVPERPSGCRLRLLLRGRFPRGLREHLQRLLAPEFLPRNRDGVFADKATEADVVPRMLERRDEPLQGQVSERIRGDELGDLRHGLLIRDELVPRLHVDPEVAREPDRRASDPDVDLFRAGLPQDLDDLPDRRAADDRVVDQDDPLVLHRGADGVQLEHDPDLAVLLVRHDERPLDVPVLDQPFDDRKSGDLRVALRLRAARLRYGYDDVGFDRILLRELLADLHAGVVHEPLVEDAVRPREVDPLEHAVCGVVRMRESHRLEAVGPELDDLPRFQVPDELQPERIEHDALRCDHHAAVSLPDAKGPDRVRIPDRVDRVVDHEGEAVRPDETAGELLQRAMDVATGVDDLISQETDDHLTVRGRHERPALLAELLPDLVRVRDVPVVREGDVPVRRLHDNRLRVLEDARAGGGIAHVADARVPADLHQVFAREDFMD